MVKPLPEIPPASLAAEITEVLNIKDARITHLERLNTASQRILTQVLHENRVHAECLVIAKKALDWYGRNCPVLLCGKAGETLDGIERRLAELEPETEVNSNG